MDLVGKLEVFEPVFVFQMLNLAGATGELKLDSPDNSAIVYFENGNVTFAEIRERPVKLGEYLVSRGYISEAQLQATLKKRRKGKRLGSLLIENGILKENALREALEEQVKETIYEAVKWNKGTFSFIEGKRPPSREISIDIPLNTLMLEGLKRWDEAGGKERE